MKTTAIIVEDFYDNPHEVREHALNLDYYQPYKNANFTETSNVKKLKSLGVTRGSDILELHHNKVIDSKPDGFKSPWYCTLPRQRYITEENISKLEYIINSKIDLDHFYSDIQPHNSAMKVQPPDKNNSTEGTRWNAAFHIKLEPVSDYDKGIHSHVDDPLNGVGSNGWVGVVFLTPDDISYRNNGVDLWENNQGLTYKNAGKMRPHPHLVDFVDHPVKDNGQQQAVIDTSGEWEMKARFQYKFNTLILHHSTEYHTSNIGWGDDYFNGRMVQTFFIKTL